MLYKYEKMNLYILSKILYNIIIFDCFFYFDTDIHGLTRTDKDYQRNFYKTGPNKDYHRHFYKTKQGIYHRHFYKTKQGLSQAFL